MNLKQQLESLLFVSGSPLEINKIVKFLNSKYNEVEDALNELIEEFKNNNRGVQIVKLENKYQMVTARESADVVQTFLRNEIIGDLTRPQLETLTIIAYRGPIVKPELEQIRGVNCTIILRNLMIRGLIEEGEIKDGMDTYVITHDFLRLLGITNTHNLPDYQKLNTSQNLNDLLNNVEERN